MHKTNADLRTRLEQLERYQLLLKFDHAELEALLLNMRLVEEQLKFETMNCGYPPQREIFGCTEARKCEPLGRLPSDTEAS